MFPTCHIRKKKTKRANLSEGISVIRMWFIKHSFGCGNDFLLLIARGEYDPFLSGF